MRIGKANIDFWLSKNLPKWAKDSFHSRPLIDACIHAHSGEKEKVCSDTANLLALCRLWRKHGKELASELQRVAESTHPQTSTKTKALARKWAERITKN